MLFYSVLLPPLKQNEDIGYMYVFGQFLFVSRIK